MNLLLFYYYFRSYIFSIIMRNFSNHFLVSMPQISDPIFGETIIYICSHDKSGAMGLIINKKINELDLKQETNEILKQT